MGIDKFQECIKWRVGNRERVSFLMDSWLRGGVLRDQFSQIFVIAKHKNISVNESLRDIRGEGNNMWR